MNLPGWTAIVPTYGITGLPLCHRLLKSLWAFHDERLGSVILSVDGGDKGLHDAYRLLAREFPKTQALCSPENRGFAHACNQAIVKAPPGYIPVLVNNDIEFISPALTQLIDFLTGHSAAVAGCRLLYPDRTIQHAGITYVPGPDGSQGFFGHPFRGMPGSFPLANTAGRRLVTGALYAIHPSAFDINGLLDERFGMACEDVDFALSAIQAGMDVLYCGYIEAVHWEGQTRGRTAEEKAEPERQVFTQREQEGFAKLWDKWGPETLNQFTVLNYR